MYKSPVRSIRALVFFLANPRPSPLVRRARPGTSGIESHRSRLVARLHRQYWRVSTRRVGRVRRGAETSMRTRTGGPHVFPPGRTYSEVWGRSRRAVWNYRSIAASIHESHRRVLRRHRRVRTGTTLPEADRSCLTSRRRDSPEFSRDRLQWCSQFAPGLRPERYHIHGHRRLQKNWRLWRGVQRLREVLSLRRLRALPRGRLPAGKGSQ